MFSLVIKLFFVLGLFFRGPNGWGLLYNPMPLRDTSLHCKTWLSLMIIFFIVGRYADSKNS